tara:strand:+ start:136 stop:891 length:756 start_codon:yes stop_codon:yes gene_type:complete
MNELWEILLLFSVGFIAGIINTLAGGGSLLTLPILIFLGLPPHVANGTNRIVILFQSITGTLGFKSKKVSSTPLDFYLGLTATLGSLLGAQIAIEMKGALFNKILAIFMFFVGLLILFQKKQTLFESSPRREGKKRIISMILFFFVGIYGGFINAGIGFIILLILTRINNLSITQANSVKVAVVTIYTTVALLLFIYNQAVSWKLGLWMALGSTLSAWTTSRWSVKIEDWIIRLFLFLMVVILATKLWLDQ